MSDSKTIDNLINKQQTDASIGEMKAPPAGFFLKSHKELLNLRNLLNLEAATKTPDTLAAVIKEFLNTPVEKRTAFQKNLVSCLLNFSFGTDDAQTFQTKLFAIIVEDPHKDQRRALTDPITIGLTRMIKMNTLIDAMQNAPSIFSAIGTWIKLWFVTNNLRAYKDNLDKALAASPTIYMGDKLEKLQESMNKEQTRNSLETTIENNSKDLKKYIVNNIDIFKNHTQGNLSAKTTILTNLLSQLAQLKELVTPVEYTQIKSEVFKDLNLEPLSEEKENQITDLTQRAIYILMDKNTSATQTIGWTTSAYGNLNNSSNVPSFKQAVYPAPDQKQTQIITRLLETGQKQEGPFTDSIIKKVH